ncbi:COG4315 family predicted lipoprotein [Kitasatospora sp. McL0602]|uniref:COG4315 family predicted lipoprotein n=1 Tax=Kitasatospora sp. McL0602 TaxID=3439530 RepID=UPI003F8BDE32
MRLAPVAALALLTAVGTGCAAPTLPPLSAPSSAEPSPASPTPAAVAAPMPKPGTTVAVAAVGELGPILVDGTGRTLYLFDADTSVQSTCADACAAAWPAVTTTGPPVAGAGADAGLIGTTPRPDGSVAVLYKGRPLYRFAGDSAVGDANGQLQEQFDSIWYVANAVGDKVGKAARVDAAMGG